MPSSALERDTSRNASRTLVAETLTKSWLMGVRRGFLSLLKPAIHDYDDVLKAFRALDKFVDNLQQQVTYVRRGPISGIWAGERQKLEEAFTALVKALDNAQDAAKHWKGCYDGTDLGARLGEGCRTDGEKMLELYRTKFSDTIQGQVKTRGKYNKERSADVVELFDKVLTILYADAKAIQENRKLTPEPMAVEESVFNEFSIGRLKVVVIDPKIRPGTIREYIANLDRAHQQLQQAKLADKVWYGILFLCADKSYILKDDEREAYRRYGYDISAKSGDYSWDGDMVRIWREPPITGTLVHELGHRYWFKGMTQSQRAKFTRLIRVKTKKPLDLQTLVSEQTRRECQTELVKATSAFQATIKTLRKDASRSKKYKKLMATFQAGMKEAASKWTFEVVVIVGKLGAHGAADSLRQDLLRTTETVGRRALFADEEIQSLMMKTPDPTGPVPDLDQYWLNIYQEQRDNWVDEIDQIVEQAFAEATIYMDAAMLEYNTRLTDSNQAALAQYNALVPAVSSYGETNEDEAFAEAFKHYVLHASMTQDQIESFRSVLVKNASEIAPAVLERYLRALKYL